MAVSDLSQNLRSSIVTVFGPGPGVEMINILGGAEEGAHTATGYTATTDGVVVTAGGVTIIAGGLTVTAGTALFSSGLSIDTGQNINLSSGCDISTSTATGTMIATVASQKLALWGATPIVQPADADQADQGVMTTVGANTGTAGAGLSAIGDTSTVDQSAALMNDLLALQEDIAALDALVTAMRTVLVNTGIMKGAA